MTTWQPSRQGGYALGRWMPYSEEWTLHYSNPNQHWTCQLVPTVPAANAPGFSPDDSVDLGRGARAELEAAAVISILSDSTPDVGGVGPDDLQNINYH